MAQKAQKPEKKKGKDKRLHVEIVTQMLTLATSGFGLVAALAWNSVIQEFVNNYIKVWLPRGGGIFSLLIYATLITALAVFITLQLSKLKERVSTEKK
jgi:TRAP-type C4-dicarboxylate transport system permease small subunit